MEGSVLSALDVAWAKATAFIREQIKCNNLALSEDEKEGLESILARDVLVLVPSLKAFLDEHAAAVKAEDCDYFIALAPPQFRHVNFSPETKAKAILFLRVFLSLLNDLSQNE